MQFRTCCLVSSYCGITNWRVLFCLELLGNCGLVHGTLLENYNLQTFALCQAIGEFQLVWYCVAPSYLGSTISRLLSGVKLLGNHKLQGIGLPRAIGGLQLAGLSKAPSHCEIAIPRPPSRVKLSENYKLRGFGLHQAIGEFLLAGSCFAPSYWAMKICRALPCVKPWGFQFACFCPTSS